MSLLIPEIPVISPVVDTPQSLVVIPIVEERLNSPVVPVTLNAPAVWVIPELAVIVPLAVNPEVAVIKPEIVGVAVQVVGTTLRVDPVTVVGYVTLPKVTAPLSPWNSGEETEVTALWVPLTSRVKMGLVVPIPTWPAEVTTKAVVAVSLI